MLKIISFLLLIFILKFTLEFPNCEDGKNFCQKCNPVTDVCIRCKNDAVIADEEGKCIGLKKCFMGQNFCEECNSEETLCSRCKTSYYPDENGQCSYTDNCELSYKGECFQCKNDYLLIGQEGVLRICKYKDPEDFVGCEQISSSTGLCQKCIENYFLTEGDRKCIETDKCFEARFSQCVTCISDYYLDIKDGNKCKPCSPNEEDENKNYNFLFCKQSEDGNVCSMCQENYYMDENHKCLSSNFCKKKNENGLDQCVECIDNYYLTKDKKSCTTEEFCTKSDKDTGICDYCEDGYYLDANDGKCKSNQEEFDDLRFCKYFIEDCTECQKNYFLAEDHKCASTMNCNKAENGLCTQCNEHYYLSSQDKICTQINHCAKINEKKSYTGANYYICEECDEGFYLDKYSNECLYHEGEDDLVGCRKSQGDACVECYEDYYLSIPEGKCYLNDLEKGSKFYKCAKTDQEGEVCEECIEGFNLGSEDLICSSVQDCALSENSEKCLKCEMWYCLDVKQNICVYGDAIDSDFDGKIEEENKLYYKCVKTNDEGTACDECQEGYDLGKNGFCVDNENCEVKDEETGECLKCYFDSKAISYFAKYFCLNEDFVCVETNKNNQHCLRCDGLDWRFCTKCEEGYKLNEYGYCNLA